MMPDASTTLFQNAVRRLEAAVRHVDIDPEALELLRHPKACLEVSIPLRMDDGSLKVFTGYRVRHDDTRGPTRGGIYNSEGLDVPSLIDFKRRGH
jgi:glutamate dehydrogenase (NADP+)